MAKIYGISASEVIPQSDFYAVQNENGGWTATQSFLVKKGGVDSGTVQSGFIAGATLGSFDTNCDEFFSGMKLTRIPAVATVEGGYTRITVEFTGFSSASYNGAGEADQAPTYTKRGVLVDESLDNHPKWKVLADDQKFALGLLIKGDAISKPDFTGVGSYNEEGIWSAWEKDGAAIVLTGDAIEFAKLIAQGQTTYKHATYEYTHRWDSNEGIDTGTMNDLGKISTPVNPYGAPPTPGTGRNWLLAGVNEEQHGAGEFRFSNELVYVLSEQEGFSTFLYS